MKLKKIAKVLLSCVLAGALFTGCGGGQGGDTKKDANLPEIKLGMIAHLNATEQKMEEILANVAEKTSVPVSKYKLTFYDSLKLLNMGVESGSVDEASVYKCVADYVITVNPKYELAANDQVKGLSDSFCFAVREEDKQLKADLDKVIGEMKADGSLDKLINDYITTVDNFNPPPIEIPMTDGAETIKVGVTGDLPPLDYVSADNQPAGFNTALLAEIAKRLGKNIEIVDIDSGARAAALASKQIDVVFWAVVPIGKDVPADIDKTKGVEMSTPYFKDEVQHIKIKKDKA